MALPMWMVSFLVEREEVLTKVRLRHTIGRRSRETGITTGSISLTEKPFSSSSRAGRPCVLTRFRMPPLETLELRAKAADPGVEAAAQHASPGSKASASSTSSRICFMARAPAPPWTT